MFSRGFISSVVNNVFLVSFFFVVVRCEACFRNVSQFLSVRHLKPAVTQRPNWTSRRIATVPSGCVVVHAADTKIRRCNRSARRYATAILGGGAQRVLSTVIPHRHSKLLVRYTRPALQDSEPASLQSESLCRSHAAPAGRQVESPRCAGPSRTGGYAAHPLNLGTINVKTDDCCGGQAPHLKFGRKHPKDVSVCRGHMLPRSWAPPLEYQSLLAGIQHASQRAA